MKKLKHLKAGIFALLLLGVSFTTHSQSDPTQNSKIVKHQALKDIDKPGDGTSDPPPPHSVGLAESVTNSFEYYPNPCKDYLQIENESTNLSADFVIYNLTGKEVIRQQINHRAKIDMSGLPAGVYVLNHNNKSYKVRKL